MTALIAALAAVAYLAVGLLTARVRFGQLRAEVIDKKVARFPHAFTDDPARAFGSIERTEVLGQALAAGFLWPLALLIGGVLVPLARRTERFVTANPKLSQAEWRLECDRQDRVIADLETECDRLRAVVEQHTD